MATPTLKAVTPPAGPTPSSAEPVIIYDLPKPPVGMAPTFAELPGTVSGATGAHLQAVLNDLATRVTALENP